MSTLNAGALTFTEFAMQESLPLATIHNAVLEFLRDRDDAVLFGAQAVNAYVHESRMTQDVDILATHAPELAETLRNFLSQRFHIAVRVREIGEGRGYRVYQVRSEGNRHLVDIRPISTLPASQRFERVLVLAPPELIAYKIIAYYQRRGKPKSGTDWRDLALLLLAFPNLKHEHGEVKECLKAAQAGEPVLALWRELAAQEIKPEDEDEEF